METVIIIDEIPIEEKACDLIKHYKGEVRLDTRTEILKAGWSSYFNDIVQVPK